MRFLATSALLLATLSPAAAQSHRPIGVETTIPFAGSGGLHNWQPGPPHSNVVFVQDRTLHWYRLQLSGPCFEHYLLDTFRYRTGPDQRLDRFSRVWSSRAPDVVCGIRSIKTSRPPHGQPGARNTRG